MVKRYLVSLNIFQRACLTGIDERSPDSFYLRKFARFVRNQHIRFYMLRDDYENAKSWLNRPALRLGLEERAPELLRDLEYVLRNVFIKEMEAELYEYARSFAALLSMDSLRLAAASLLQVDGIVSMEPEDFVQDPDDITDIRQHGKGSIFLEYATTEEGERDRITIFVATPYSFLIQLDNDLGEIGCSRDDSAKNRNARGCPKLNVLSWELLTEKDGVRKIGMTVSYCVYSCTYRNSLPETGEVDSLFLAVNECARELFRHIDETVLYLPKFHTSYTTTSAQGLPGLINVEVGLSYLDRVFKACVCGDSTIACTLNAYVDALNKVVLYSHTGTEWHHEH